MQKEALKCQTEIRSTEICYNDKYITPKGNQTPRNYWHLTSFECIQNWSITIHKCLPRKSYYANSDWHTQSRFGDNIYTHTQFSKSFTHSGHQTLAFVDDGCSSQGDFGLHVLTTDYRNPVLPLEYK